MSDDFSPNDDSDEIEKSNTQNEMWDKIRNEVEVFCARVFELVNKILSSHSNFGFSEIGQNIDPSFEDILKIMQVTEFALGTYSSNGDDFSQQRQIYNASQMIWCVKGLVMAIKAGNIADYEAMIKKMRDQAQH